MSNTPGLRYRAVTFQSLKKPIWVVQDYDQSFWIDAKSVIEAIGMSWAKWQLALRRKRTSIKLDSCLDRNGAETFLVSELFFLPWLREMEPLLQIYPGWASARAMAIRSTWRDRFEAMLESEHLSPPTATEDQATPNRRRKITAETVIRIHHQRIVVGKSISYTAKAVGISEAAVKAIEAGTYKAFTPESREAWRSTFGTTA